MSLFMLDTGGDQALLSGEGKRKQSTVYKSDKLASVLLKESNVVESKTIAPPTIKQTFSDNDDGDDDDFFGLPPPSVDVTNIINSTLAATRDTTTSKTMQEVDEAIDQVEEAIRNAGTHKKPKQPLKRGQIQKIDNSDINPLTGKLDDERVKDANAIQQLQTSKLGLVSDQTSAKHSLRRKRQLNRNERDKTKGAGWFDLPATEITEDVRNELKIIQMRSVLDPKHFYKKNDLKVLPKYFQIGTVQHSPLDYYKERNIRKTKKSLVDQLLEDEAFQKFNKRKYNEVVERTNKYAHRKAMQKMRKLKKHK